MTDYALVLLVLATLVAVELWRLGSAQRWANAVLLAALLAGALPQLLIAVWADAPRRPMANLAVTGDIICFIGLVVGMVWRWRAGRLRIAGSRIAWPVPVQVIDQGIRFGKDTISFAEMTGIATRRIRRGSAAGYGFLIGGLGVHLQAHLQALHRSIDPYALVRGGLTEWDYLSAFAQTVTTVMFIGLVIHAFTSRRYGLDLDRKDKTPVRLASGKVSDLEQAAEQLRASLPGASAAAPVPTAVQGKG